MHLQRLSASRLTMSFDNLEHPETTIHTLNKMLTDALSKRASDIHIEPIEHHYRIRYRIDGLLQAMAVHSHAFAERLITRLKTLAQLDIATKRLPQDGSFKTEISSNTVLHVRVSSCPLVDGEKLVLRLLKDKEQALDVTALGMSLAQEKLFLETIHRPEGMILVTGPTGCGKTSTLYSALNLLNTLDKNISTVEDPVEIRLPGINQVNIHPKAGLHFSTVLRALLRQDPDIIMLGEIRDLESAEVAFKAAQTGHLVLSTLHSNNTQESISRLFSMGIPPVQIASCLKLVVAQRLLRRLCPHCMGAPASQCTYCMQGYSGRTGIFEFLPLSPAVVSVILSESTNHSLCIQSLYQSGLAKVAEGLTSLEELQRVVATEHL